MNIATRDLVHERSGQLLRILPNPQVFDDLPFQIEHIIAKVHGGTDDPENLALACVPCNLFKGTNLAGIDPDFGKNVRLFRPCGTSLEAAFRWSSAILEGKSAVGRATIKVLRINLPLRIEFRRLLIELEVFPPEDS